MTDIAIHVDGISKEYQIGQVQQTQETLSQQLADLLVSPFRRAGKLVRGQVTGAAELDNSFWALQDISFEVKRGEAVGIIGRNGAGKSTLLKILSRITEPTRGEAKIYGRVGSLLEVGTGFHPELTGRENIYLNGAILGMGKAEIDQKFDEIVAFANIDQFIDTPVKHYSSGMYVRLAFSVAAHLEPEVLLVDEVLAVGDIAFQRKCLGKMNDVAQQGRTVLFVSHNMSLMQMLCQRGIFLQEGQIIRNGTITEAVDAYLQSLEKIQTQDLISRTDRKGQGKVRLTSVEITESASGPNSPLKTGRPARFVFHFDKMLIDLACDFSIYDQIGQPLAHFQSKLRSPEDQHDAALDHAIVCEIDKLPLMPGRYRVDVSLIGDNRLQDFVEAATVFDVGDGTLNDRPIKADKNNRFRMLIPHRWIRPQ